MTRQQIKIFSLLASGLTNRKVAAKLGMALRTLEKEIRKVNILNEAKSTLHSVAILIRSGVIK